MKFNLNIKHNTVIFAMLMAFCVIAFIASAHSEETYIYIGTKAELEAFRDRVNNGETSLNAKLTADIDLQGSEENQWVPIGHVSTSYEKEYYAGQFDGGNHTISGIYINKSGVFDQGFFQHCVGAEIKNLTVKGNIVVSGGEYAGGICGDLSGGKITNCVNKVAVKGNSDSYGGICGSAKCGSIIENCINEANITQESSSVREEGRVGGICGIAYGATIKNCVNKGNVSSMWPDTGGICGYVWSLRYEPSGERVPNKIINCANIGNVTSTSESTGGICGYIEIKDSGNIDTVRNCMNTGKISGSSYVGGVIGCVVNIL